MKKIGKTFYINNLRHFFVKSTQIVVIKIMNINNIRTDLALESRNIRFSEDEKIRGIRVSEEKDCRNNINVVKLEVLNRAGEHALGRPMGTYITMEVPEILKADEGTHREISRAFGKELRRMIIKNHNFDASPSILVVGLGNRDATSDSLGPRVVSNLLITRHIVEHMGYKGVEGVWGIVSAIAPGVMAQTGMDTSEIISALVDRISPDIVIAIDALAARDMERLCCTIQITDTGIHPGSGVGNDREKLNRRTLGVPVIAVGVPTVIDARTLFCDFSEHEQVPENFSSMYVTSKDIDAIIKRISYTLSEGINMCISQKKENINVT